MRLISLLRRRTEQAAALAAELRGAFISPTICGASRVEVLVQHQPRISAARKSPDTTPLRRSDARHRSAFVQVSGDRLRILEREVPLVGTPLHFVGLSTQRRGSMDARQEASSVWVRLVGGRRNPATDWRPTAALTLTARDERFAATMK